MREIKFRGWNEEEKKMLDKIDVSSRRSTWSWFGQMDIVIMQYTGLKDKNGKEIYEGDIVEHVGRGIGEIHWDNGYWVKSPGSEACDRIYTTDPLVVIGNIYENPELISE